MKILGASLILLTLPFGMASAWLEQSILTLYPRLIGDSRLVAIVSLYGSMVITYLACAAISTVALPTGEFFPLLILNDREPARKNYCYLKQTIKELSP